MLVVAETAVHDDVYDENGGHLHRRRDVATRGQSPAVDALYAKSRPSSLACATRGHRSHDRCAGHTPCGVVAVDEPIGDVDFCPIVSDVLGKQSNVTSGSPRPVSRPSAARTPSSLSPHCRASTHFGGASPRMRSSRSSPSSASVWLRSARWARVSSPARSPPTPPSATAMRAPTLRGSRASPRRTGEPTRCSSNSPDDSLTYRMRRLHGRARVDPRQERVPRPDPRDHQTPSPGGEPRCCRARAAGRTTRRTRASSSRGRHHGRAIQPPDAAADRSLTVCDSAFRRAGYTSRSTGCPIVGHTTRLRTADVALVQCASTDRRPCAKCDHPS